MKKRLLLLLLACLLLTACGEQNPEDMWAPWVPEAPSLDLVQTSLDGLTVPEGVKVVGLGEASHGVKEYQEMKGAVFQALVENNGCRSFIIEGDFGSAIAVDEYIHGGEGTAQEAANQIGFRIYRTQEMADILTWMRQYNETAPEGEDLHFYGMDIQWADASKDYLFQVLDRVPPALGEKVQGFRERLEFLNDDDMFDLTAQEFEQGTAVVQELLEAMDAAQGEMTAAVGERAFAFARECAHSLSECCTVRGASNLQYNELRDIFMAKKVQWYLDQGDGSLLFINGHNGHIAKEGETTYTSLGENLWIDLQGAYFAIGTNAAVTAYNAQGEDGSFTEVTVENNDPLTRLATELKQEQGAPWYYADFSAVRKDSNWEKLLSQTWSMTSLNVGVSILNTGRIVPEKAYDGMIVFDTVSPTTLKLDE